MEKIQQKKVAMISPDGKKSFVPLTEFMSKVRYANLANVKIRDLENNRDYNPTYKKYTKSQIVTYLANPANYEVQLRQMGQYLYFELLQAADPVFCQHEHVQLHRGAVWR